MALRVTPVYAMNPPRLTRIITIVPIVTTAAFKSNPDKTRVTTNTAPKDIPKDVMVSAKKPLRLYTKVCQIDVVCGSEQIHKNAKMRYEMPNMPMVAFQSIMLHGFNNKRLHIYPSKHPPTN